MSHAFYRTAQGRLPKPMSLKGMTTFFFWENKNNRWRFLVLIKIEYEINIVFGFSEDSYGNIEIYIRPEKYDRWIS